ncbi:sulfatase family protein [Aureliella helgolandensis]|uniref:Choline-sulfatase n=1 Tax=Aureliella helgolandensis TaxID=2527968 RepID=A0A518G3X4_9BACT|nr:sulfatase [Aureliella helgolandensis]QDV23260.1 Choline-sulfatase [Aureliella helgolandensis]
MCSRSALVLKVMMISLFLGMYGSMAGQAAQRHPNLLIIQTDEHNFRTLGCYRNLLPPEQAFVWGKEAIVETPHIDSLAKRGALCTSYYATSPVCTPSRAALLTGRYPQNTGSPSNDLPLNDDIITVAERLRQVGYRTGFAGKWHLDGPGKPQWEPDRQFGFTDNRYMFNRGHWKTLELTEDGPRVASQNAAGQPDYGVRGADATTFTTDWLTDRALEFIRASRDQPFCYMLSIPDPHGPNRVRAPYDQMFQASAFSPPATFDQSKDQTPAYVGPPSKQFNADQMALYFGMVKCIDDNVGRLLAALETEGMLENTVVVFTSDHGDLCGEHHRDNKGNPYEASARVPFLIAAPGKIQPGTVLDAAMAGIDFTPTILRLLGTHAAEAELDGVEGRDLSPLFTASTTNNTPQPSDYVILRRAGVAPGWVAVVTDRYKLVLSPQDDPWLFDLEQDPDELTNFLDSPQHRDVRMRLAQAMAAYGPAHQDSHLRHPKMLSDLELLQR